MAQEGRLMTIEQASQGVRDARLTPVQWRALMVLVGAVEREHHPAAAWSILRCRMVALQVQAMTADI